jgi:hypothetical protein
MMNISNLKVKTMEEIKDTENDVEPTHKIFSSIVMGTPLKLTNTERRFVPFVCV